MALSITVNGAGTFTASMEEGPVSFTASLGAVGPQGPAGATGPTGVVAAASPITYDSGTQTVGISPTPTFTSVTVNDGGNTALIEPGQAWFYGPTSQMIINEVGLTFPDNTEQTTAFVGEARKVYIIGRNNTGTTIAKGKVVRLSGATGNKPTIALAQADTEGNSARTIGITVEAIADNADGKVIVSGAAENIDTSAFNAGDTVHLSASTAGGLVTALPTQPLHGVVVGIVTRANPSIGSIEVAINNYQELGELSDVLVSSKANNDLLAWDSTASVWKNRTFSALGLLTSATAASTYAPIVHTHTASQISDSTSAGRALLTAADASAQRTSLGLGTMAVETAVNYALLASPTFSGTPSLPTGTIAVTQAAGNNTTAVATTAFVQTSNPDASTTVKGHVELATATEAIAATSTTLAATPDDLFWNRATPGMGLLLGTNSNALTSGTGASSNASMFGITCFGPDSGVVGYGGRRFQMNNGQVGSLEREWGVVDFDRRITLSFRIAPVIVSSGSPNNDSVINVNYGDLLGTDTGGTLARKGFGIQIYGHNNPLRLTVHDGTTYRTVDSSYTPTSSTTPAAMDFMLVSEAGTVSLYQRTTRTGGWSQIATSANGPTGLSAANASSVTCTSRNESINVTTVRWRCLAGFFTVEY